MKSTVETASSPAQQVSISSLRRAIPEYCFKPDNWLSFYYVVRDLCLASVLFTCSLWIPLLDSACFRVCLWLSYSVLQGFIFTGLWILAHECGHGALFSRSWLNLPIGFTLHSLLLVPFFSWQYTHHRHHRYTNNMTKDTVFVPSLSSTWQNCIEKTLHMAEDTPILTFISLVMHQLLGWPLYILTYVSGGVEKPKGNDQEQYLIASHLNPLSGLFSTAQQPYILLSNLGLLLVFFCLKSLSSIVGVNTVLLAYGLPYLWVNNWIVAITYLHHNHEDVLHYDQDRWTFLDGALSTVDRDFGFVGKHLFHGIVEFHVIHHIFPRIPFYHAEEATAAIQPVVGTRYRRDTSPFFTALWNTFRSCKTVVPKPDGTLSWKQLQLHK